MGGGNVFSIIGVASDVVLLENRTPVSQGCAPLSFLVRLIYELVKWYCFMTCWLPWSFRVFSCVSGSWFLRYWNSPRRTGFLYPDTPPCSGRRLTFSYCVFELQHFSWVVEAGLEWTRKYYETQGDKFMPHGFAVYFNTQTDATIAPHSGAAGGVVFSFDPIYHQPDDERWLRFCDAFNSWAKEAGAFPAINQTIGIGKHPEWGAQVVDGEPQSRFLSEWLRPYFEAKGASAACV